MKPILLSKLGRSLRLVSPVDGNEARYENAWGPTRIDPPAPPPFWPLAFAALTLAGALFLWNRRRAHA